MKKGMPWESPSLDAWVFLKYAGEVSLPKLKLFPLLDHVASFSSINTWKLPSHQNVTALIISGLVHQIDNIPNLWQEKIHKPTILNINYCYYAQVALLHENDPLKNL